MGILGKLFGKKNQPQPSQPTQQVSTPVPVNQYTEAFHKAIEKMATEKPEDEVRISIPPEINGKQIAYKYDDVQLISAGVHSSKINPSVKLTLKENNNKVEVYQGDLFLGTLPENRLSGMVHDWNIKGDPYLAYISYYSDAGEKVEIYLVFYNNKVERFTSKSDTKQMKLTGKPEEFHAAFVGAECEAEYDFEKEKYFVTYEGSVLGTLPAAATKYAEAHNISPENLRIIVTAIDYDDEKDRDIITVCISD